MTDTLLSHGCVLGARRKLGRGRSKLIQYLPPRRARESIVQGAHRATLVYRFYRSEYLKTRLLLERGWNVVATTQTPDASPLACAPDRLRVIALDATDDGSIRAAEQRALSSFEHIEVLINNAGIGSFFPFEVMRLSAIQKISGFGSSVCFASMRKVCISERFQA